MIVRVLVSPASKSRLIGLLLIASAALLLSGCVYLRLLELKKQLSAFEKHFTVASAEGVTIHCLHPVLEGDDLRWLGLAPSAIHRKGGAERWVVRWKKELPPGVTEATNYDVEIETDLVDDLLTEVRIPERFFAYVSKDLFLNVLRSAGTAAVDKTDRSTDATTEAPPETALPTLSAITSMLGVPTRQQQKKNEAIYIYRFRLDAPDKDTRPIEVRFSFDTTSGDLRTLTGRLPRGTMNFKLAPPPQGAGAKKADANAPVNAAPASR